MRSTEQNENKLPEEVRRAAEVIKAFCNERTGDDACKHCPFYHNCCGEPYTWEE